MILLYIFIIGCFVTGIVAVGLVFAFAAVGFGGGSAHGEASPPDKTIEPSDLPNQKIYRL